MPTGPAIRNWKEQQQHQRNQRQRNYKYCEISICHGEQTVGRQMCAYPFPPTCANKTAIRASTWNSISLRMHFFGNFVPRIAKPFGETKNQETTKKKWMHRLLTACGRFVSMCEHTRAPDYEAVIIFKHRKIFEKIQWYSVRWCVELWRCFWIDPIST